MKPHRYALCLCCDANMIVPALFVADAAKRAAGDARSFDTYLVVLPGEDLTSADRGWCRDRGIRIVDDLDISSIRDIPVVQERLSHASLLRLLLPGHFARGYDKLLYLDCDLVIHGDVSPIFTADTEAAPLAAVIANHIWAGRPDAARQRRSDHMRALGMTEPLRFFNSGVMLMDVAKWNATELTPRVLDYLSRNAELCFLPDEHALNAVLDGDFAELSPIWNARADYPGMAVMNAVASPVIVHYAGPVKPWIRFGYGYPLFPDRDAMALYRAFVEDTPWSDRLDRSKTPHQIYKTFAGQLTRITRFLRGTLDEPRRSTQAEVIRAFRDYNLSRDYVDVRQGIAAMNQGYVALRN